MSQSDAEWLAGLKVGDEVAVPRRWDGYSIYTVIHATPTQIHAGYGKYRRKDGYEMGASRYGRIEPVTDEIRADIRRREVIGLFLEAAERKNVQTLPTHRIEAALALLQPEPSSGSPTP